MQNKITFYQQPEAQHLHNSPVSKMGLVAEYPIFGIGRLALPVWDQRNEAVQSVSHPNCEGRNWYGKPGELTSSTVPRRTSSTGWRNFIVSF